MSKFCYLDFEFTGIANFDLSLICCAVICRDKGREVDRRSFWLWDGTDNHKAKRYFKMFGQNPIKPLKMNFSWNQILRNGVFCKKRVSVTLP